MKKLLLLGCACSFLGQLIFAQTAYYPRDTTYSITSAYYHIQKQYPDVVPVRPNLPKGIEASLNLVYAELENGRQLHLDILRPKKGKRKKRVAVVMKYRWNCILRSSRSQTRVDWSIGQCLVRQIRGALRAMERGLTINLCR